MLPHTHHSFQNWLLMVQIRKGIYHFLKWPFFAVLPRCFEQRFFFLRNKTQPIFRTMRKSLLEESFLSFSDPDKSMKMFHFKENLCCFLSFLPIRLKKQRKIHLYLYRYKHIYTHTYVYSFFHIQISKYNSIMMLMLINCYFWPDESSVCQRCSSFHRKYCVLNMFLFMLTRSLPHSPVLLGMTFLF